MRNGGSKESKVKTSGGGKVKPSLLQLSTYMGDIRGSVHWRREMYKVLKKEMKK